MQDQLKSDIPAITPALFTFLEELKQNNDREWFHANKKRYEKEVRNPLLQFIAGFSGPLSEISPHYIADPRPVGGSLFRIYRDVRFSKDKSPYKTHAGIQFRQERGKDAHAPGFYLHFEPGNVFCAAGVWQPDSSSLNKIRGAIEENPEKWQKIFSNREFANTFKPGGDSLKRPPRGFDPDHPFIEDLKRKDFFVITTFSEETACSPEFMKTCSNAFKISAPFMRFLNEALNFEW
ncbi:MAG: DUF2461 domain-containing protein [Calditrichia bacterium]